MSEPMSNENNPTPAPAPETPAEKTFTQAELEQYRREKFLLGKGVPADAVDGVTGKDKKYVGPLEFWQAEDKAELWTMSAGGTKTHGVDGSCFFVKGEAVHPDLDVQAIEMMYDHVYDITSIDEGIAGKAVEREFGK